jgi:hypothetical protein
MRQITLGEQTLRDGISCVGVSGFVISTGGMALVRGPLSDSYLWGFALTWMLIPAFNFVIYFMWVFQPGRHLQERM